MRCAIKRRSLPKVAQVQKQITAEKAASCLKTSCGAITSIASISYYVSYIYSIVSLHYQQCSVVYGIYQLTARVNIRKAYLPSSSAKSELKGFIPRQTFKVPPFLQCKDRGTHHLRVDLKKAQ